MYEVTDTISIAPWELTEVFIRAPGPGGQNVNKVATAVQLRFSVNASPALAAQPATKARLKRLAGRRLTNDGEIVIEASRFRSQERNRADARERLFDMIRKAAIQPRKRKPTKPTRASQERRLKKKKERGAIKALRQRGADD